MRSKHPSNALWLLAVVIVTGCASSWDQAVERANERGYPLIVEFHAEWCGPCKRFERDVLSDAEVVRELETVEFARYDYDSTSGKHHARRLGVRGVPTFVAVGPGGDPIGVLKGAVSKEKFLHFVAWSRQQRARR